MYAPPKLPLWQLSPASHSRPGPGRRYRIIIFLALCIIIWHQLIRTVPSNDTSNTDKVPSVEKSIASKYPNGKGSAVVAPERTENGVIDEENVPRKTEIFGADSSPTAIPEKEISEVVTDDSDIAAGDEEEVEDLTTEKEPVTAESLDTPEKTDPDSYTAKSEQPGTDSIKQPIGAQEGAPIEAAPEKVPLGMSNDTELRNSEPEDDEVSQKSDSKPKKEIVQKPIDKPPQPGVHESLHKVVEQHLSPAAAKDTGASDTLKTLSDPSKFPTYEEYAELSATAETLPDIVHTPFEDSTKDVVLQGWEDLWFSEAELDVAKHGNLEEPKIDFVYTWVNGSDQAFQETIYPYEVNSTLNDPEGLWLESHRVNRYRDWDELRYSIRTVEKYAGSFRNKIQLLVNSVADPEEAKDSTVEQPATIVGKQKPLWLKDDEYTNDVVQILSAEDYFDEDEKACLPTFNSLTIENQLFNTPSTTDRVFALSDDMLLGKEHAASDIYSPLFGPTMGFKSNSYNTVNPPTDLDARRFGEKPFLIYTSWLLNRRFGERKRKGQIHFGHSLSRSVMKEAIKSFPRPALQSSCQRFRGETGFQLYSWYVTFHYTIERQREALLWSYIMQRVDTNSNGNLDWTERQKVMEDLAEGMLREGEPGFRKRMFYQMAESLEAVGLEAPKVNIDVLWTSLDGPAQINNIECFEFNVNECLAPGFSTPSSDATTSNYVFSTASIFDRVARQHPKCGDCLIKLLLNRVEKGLSPLLPNAQTQAEARKTVIKALWKYQYAVVDPDAYFVMITDAEQVENVLFKRLIKKRGMVGQLCLNDDVSTEDPEAVAAVRKVMMKLLQGIVPEPTKFEKDVQEELEEMIAEGSVTLKKKSDAKSSDAKAPSGSSKKRGS